MCCPVSFCRLVLRTAVALPLCTLIVCYARALRKELNARAFQLSKEIKALHPRIGKDLFYQTISTED